MVPKIRLQILEKLIPMQNIHSEKKLNLNMSNNEISNQDTAKVLKIIFDSKTHGSHT